MTATGNTASGLLVGLFQWWHMSLLSVLPEKMRPWLEYREPAVDVEIDNEDQLEDAIAGIPQHSLINVRLGKDLVLRRQVSAPIVGRRDVPGIVRLELERLMPLPVDQLIYAYSTKRLEDTIEIDLVVARKAFSDALFMSCTRNNVVVNRVWARLDQSGINATFRFPTIVKRNFLRSCLVFVFFALLTLSISVIPSVYNDRLEQEILAIDDQVAATRQQTESIAGLQRQMQVMQGLYLAVKDKRREASALSILNNLTSASPDDVVFEDVRLDAGRLYVTGIAVAPENWVLTLENSPFFSDVTLSSVVGLSDNLSKRFEVRFDLDPSGDSQ